MPPERTIASFARLGLALGVLLSCLTGCSGYPDDYTDICPEVDRLKLSQITATGVTVSWETDHLTVPFLRFDTPRAPEIVIRGSGRESKHTVVVTGLIPDSEYVMTLIKDLGGVGDFADLPTTCGVETELGFRTRSAIGADAEPDQVLDDPVGPIVP